MELSKNYVPSSIEEKWYSEWISKNYFHSIPDGRKPYTIVMPPPNVTGVLHMGHCLNNTIQDILIRRARMSGFNACWVPGTDHASIATEARVVSMLREKGISKSSLTRDQFLEYTWSWTRQYGGIILQQLRKLGCSCDWDRTSFTMDPHYYQSVINVFTDLYKKGFIYRGKRMINWDPKAKTALSDEEVVYREVNSQLYYIKYPLDEEGKFITIATARPETILGDSAICVNPKDERYKDLQGRFAYVPLINRKIPIIYDEYVSMDFGTGALKVTPAHDMNDYQLGQKHNLEVIDVLNEDGTMSQQAQLFIGEDRFEARKKIVNELKEKGFLVKTEDYINQLGFSERTDSVVEPRLSMQWWVSMKKLSEPALAAVMEDVIKFYPSKFKNLYRNWMENIRDWCISRQLWWGHRIPAWYDEEGNVYVASTKEEALKQFREKNPSETREPKLVQDEDTLDTWFSSWLWPIEVFKGLSKPGNDDLNYYYPTQTLVTAPEIIFFWVARMIISGYEYMKEKAFSNVYFTGIVRDKLGRKMSKSLGNSPDLLELVDKYGADAVRFGIMISSPAGNDLLWDEASNEQGRNFNNKLWNAMKLVISWRDKPKIEPVSDKKITTDFSIRWFNSRLQEAKLEIDQLFSDYRLSEGLKLIYSLIWDDFCSWYLEWVKPVSNNPEIYKKTIDFFDELLQLLHPYMPFVSEEIYHLLKSRAEGDDLMIKQISVAGKPDKNILTEGKMLQELITSVREARAKNNLSMKNPVKLHIQTANPEVYNDFRQILMKQVNADELLFVTDMLPGTFTIVAGKDKIYLESQETMDHTSQRSSLEKDLHYLQDFLQSIERKLSNQGFLAHAKPELVELEKKKKNDTEAKIRAIEESLQHLH